MGPLTQGVDVDGPVLGEDDKPGVTPRVLSPTEELTTSTPTGDKRKKPDGTYQGSSKNDPKNVFRRAVSSPFGENRFEKRARMLTESVDHTLDSFVHDLEIMKRKT
jgi:hypothetical protein